MHLRGGGGPRREPQEQAARSSWLAWVLWDLSMFSVLPLKGTSLGDASASFHINISKALQKVMQPVCLMACGTCMLFVHHKTALQLPGKCLQHSSLCCGALREPQARDHPFPRPGFGCLPLLWGVAVSGSCPPTASQGNQKSSGGKSKRGHPVMVKGLHMALVLLAA